MIFLKLFIVFSKIGIFNFGGGYAMLSLIQDEVVHKNQWLTTAEFTDIVAISQSTPGPIGINCATYTGYTSVINAGYPEWAAMLGSVLASLSIMWLPFILMICISKYLIKNKESKNVKNVFSALRPAIVGLLAAAAIMLMSVENFGSPTQSTFVFIVSLTIFLFSFIGNTSIQDTSYTHDIPLRTGRAVDLLMKETCNTYTLQNGMRLIHIPSPTSVAYCGISIDAGTRDELESEQGMAHFCEHMMFKGSEQRKACHIIRRMENVGGDLNAYTNKEETVVYSAFMKQHLVRAAELIVDVVFNSIYPQQEIDKEAEVIVDEIESYNDSPADLIFDRFENIIYEGKDLGHDILGRAEDIRRFTSADAKAFTTRLYKPEKMVFFVMGDYEFNYVRKTVERYANNH